MSEVLEEWLEHELRGLFGRTQRIVTLSNGKVNQLERIEPAGVWISTSATQAKGSGPQLVPAWMLNTAWRHLRSTGALSNRYLLAAEGLNVKRSSAVCALLAHLPGVHVASSRPIELRYRPEATGQ